MTTSRATTPAVGGTREVPLPDPIARDYLVLALRLGQHVSGLVDGYFGPADPKALVDTEQLVSPARLVGEAAELRARLTAEVDAPDRRDWLDAQLVALETQARALAGAALPYLEHVSRCFALTPRRRQEAVFEVAAAELDALLPGDGPLDDRLAAWDARFVIDPDRLPGVVDWLVDRLRARARALFGLPAGESLRVGFVRNQPWSAYNWYEGGLRSRVDLNLDLPIRAADLAITLAHETYPGHHLEHAWKEAELVNRLGRLEASVLLINTPECLISEGLANLGRRFAAPDSGWADLFAELYERAELPIAADVEAAREAAELTVALAGPRQALGEIGVNAALLRHADERSHDEVLTYLREVGRLPADRAAKRLEFIEHPLWRTYIFVYSEGEALLSRWVDAAPDGEQVSRFARLLREQLTPRALAADLAGRSDTTPPA